MSIDYIVSLSDADVVLSGKPVLKNISWCIGKGENWRVDGVNGSGKTTLLKTVAGLIWPVAKQPPARIYGLTDRPSHLLVGVKSNIGFASYSMQDEYIRGQKNISCFEVIASGFDQSIVVYGELTCSQLQAVSQIINFLELNEFINSPFMSVSHGQKSAVLFARAIVLNPMLLVLDEIFNGVDQLCFEQMVSLLKKYKTQGGQIILSWHEQGVAAIETLFSHRVTLENGEVISIGENKVTDDYNDKIISSATHLNKQLNQSNTETSLVRFQDVNVYLQNKHILKNVNWIISQAQRWLIKGRNGAGKTTLLKTLLAEIRPSVDSQIWRKGFDNRCSVWQIRKLIGYVSPELQQAYRYNISVKEAVASGYYSSIGLYDQLDDIQEKRVVELIEMFNLGQLGQAGVHQISSGQMRRVLIARALVRNPEILVLDEITANLDQTSRAVIFTVIEDLIQQNKTFIFVGHNAQELRGLYNRVLVLEQGSALIENQ